MSESVISASLLQLLCRLWQHIDVKRRAQLLLILALMLVVSCLEIFSIGAVLPFLGVLTSPSHVYAHPLAQGFISAFGLQQPADLLFPLTSIFVLAALVAGLGRMLLLWATTKLSFAIGADLAVSIYQKTLYQPYSVHVARNSGEVIHGISVKAPGVTSDVIFPVLTILSSMFLLIIVVSALLCFNPTIAAMSLAGFGGIYALVIKVTRRRLLNDSQVVAREGARMIRALQEGLGAIRDVLIDGSQDVYCRAYQASARSVCRAQARRLFLGQSPRFILESLGMLLIAVLAYNLAVQEDGLAKALPILGVLAMSAQRLMPVLQQAYLAWASIQGGRASLMDALAFLNQPVPNDFDKHVERLPFVHSLELRNVCFSYNDSVRKTLSDISLSIKKGQRVGFIGATGSGKSTLLDLVMALLEPNEGFLEVDGVPVTAINRRAWQARLAHVPQAVFISDGTVESNIALGVTPSAIDHAAVCEAAERAQLADVIDALPNKYQTEVGERGVKLSGGQRQRLGIARALYKKADVIILDEATSALDNETEMAVMREIEKLDHNLTILIIAHRLSTLKNCSLIVQVANGRIEKVGAYDELIAT